jgi:hypothetical protein
VGNPSAQQFLVKLGEPDRVIAVEGDPAQSGDGRAPGSSLSLRAAAARFS